MEKYGSGDIALTILSSAQDGDEWSASRPSCFTPGETAPGTHWIGCCIGPRAGVDAVGIENLFPLPGIEPQPSNRQPAAIRISDVLADI
jgi:hypothetical protein